MNLIRCPNCNVRLKVDREKASSTIRCPRCRHAIDLNELEQKARETVEEVEEVPEVQPVADGEDADDDGEADEGPRKRKRRPKKKRRKSTTLVTRNRIFGAIGVFWGAVIVVSGVIWMLFGQAPATATDPGAYSAGRGCAMVFGLLMFGSGLYYLIRG
jgi:Zn-finger nucleic acid-binding protein